MQLFIFIFILARHDAIAEYVADGDLADGAVLDAHILHLGELDLLKHFPSP